MNLIKKTKNRKSIASRLLRCGVSAVFTAFAAASSLIPGTAPQAAAISKTDTIKIMPVGDSITYGMGDTGGYRKFLDYFMKEKGYTGIDFVGPEGQNSANFSYNGKQVTYDDNHAGYSGFQIKQPASWGQDSSLYNKLREKNAVKQAQPDIILLIIGTNDMTANRSMSDCANDLKDLVNYMLGDMPAGGKVFMGSIPEFTAYGGTDGRVTRYNNTVKQVAEELKSSGKNVEFADIHGCLNGTADLGFDGLHPNGTGYEKMGKFWAETIDDYLSSSAPVVTTTTTITTTTTTTTTSTTTITTTEAPAATMLGDVNLDSRITLGDALAVLQFIANEDKYPLNETQQANADVFNGTDGITGNDAVVIQMVDTGAVKASDLPVAADTDLFSK